MTMFSEVIKEFQWGGHKVRTETGEIARQVSGVVLLDMDDIVVLATVVGAKNPKPGQDFFPPAVDYLEKIYVAGRIPGGFLEREGRSSENETLTSRLIGRPLRPLFPESFHNEVQAVIHVLSMNPEVPADIPVLMAASAALAMSDPSFNGPVGTTRAGYKGSQHLLDLNRTQLACSDLDLVVAGAKRAVPMVESETQRLSEEAMLGAVVYDHEQMRITVNAIHELVRDGGKSGWDWQTALKNGALVTKASELGLADLQATCQLHQKPARSQKLKEIYESAATKLAEAGVKADGVEVDNTLFEPESKIVRSQVLDGEPRTDDRDTRMARPIETRLSVLPHAHGSALFTRGEAQALMVAMLDTKSDEQIIDALQGKYRDRFVLHYNMPSFTMGETGRMDSPKRHEVGHDHLVKHALTPVLPKDDEFAYTVRLVSETTESNDSSSMASVYGSSLALTDAGMSFKTYVAGVAMSLILEDNKFVVLTGILGDENHLGDMDFKIAGIDAGITALQMDIKVRGITKEIMQVALVQTREDRPHILSKTQAAMDGVHTELSKHAPHMITIKISPEKIYDVIGKGGLTIRALTEETGCMISIQEGGMTTIASTSSESMAEVKRCIESTTAEAEVGKIYSGTVPKLPDFGATVNIPPGKDSLLHISETANERVNQVSDCVKEGRAVCVKLLSTDEKGRVRLSIEAAKAEGGDVPAAAP